MQLKTLGTLLLAIIVLVLLTQWLFSDSGSFTDLKNVVSGQTDIENILPNESLINLQDSSLNEQQQFEIDYFLKTLNKIKTSSDTCHSQYWGFNGLYNSGTKLEFQYVEEQDLTFMTVLSGAQGDIVQGKPIKIEGLKPCIINADTPNNAFREYSNINLNTKDGLVLEYGNNKVNLEDQWWVMTKDGKQFCFIPKVTSDGFFTKCGENNE
jgi:hypothetical protein